ncbi:ATPase component of various ABC-type transport systems with duplicated ATPase domain [Methanolobus tindarius DSM 2278]|uniref:ATPase component of various ABC-type transport systems with duplicated ATPase domain n=1 Tax=Methanolobus tindarius DSM 2278 TaxID=1090322 RepID=W9DRC0_METTI|nr:ABC transporter ATP-binding protein [Methanolobus tindarius]ETA69299.1 ATPase component of various ABC-type transport systems with duplicated ATPase domain [Methanolobus tindarius DSM 2278]
MKILETKDLCKIYGDDAGNELHALKNVNIHASKGEIVGIVGESGCGKSTFANIIACITKSTSGKILFNNEDITHLNYKERRDYYKSFQMVFQSPLDTFSPKMKVERYMIEPSLNFKLMDKKSAKEYAKELLATVGLSEGYMKKYPSELSGGELQRVVIARAIGLKPELMIFDECTSALDVSIQQKIINLIIELQKEKGFTIMFITHNLVLAENICDRIYVMKSGEVVDVLNKGDFRNASHPYTKNLIDSIFTIEKLKEKAS